jgi:hypothetical protein
MSDADILGDDLDTAVSEDLAALARRLRESRPILDLAFESRLRADLAATDSHVSLTVMSRHINSMS